ncbi:ribonuclease P protein component [Bacillus spongiae]|uniref:Ribonuclease P protein component n=1 Tax=Bacillus spongiae TaxID=2683610 RepID=A0ABU8HGS0_9BACI
MKKEYRLKKNREFQEVFNKGTSFANRQYVVYVLPKKEQDVFRVGLSVSKKIGKAVTRNQIKRYIRQVFLELKDEVEKGNDYIIIARKPAADMNFHETKKSLIHVLSRSKVLKRKKNANTEK